MESLNDSRLNIYIRDFLSDLTFKIYYDDAFRLNLSDYISNENRILKYVYTYGYNYLFTLFYAYFSEQISLEYIAKILQTTSDEVAKLYELYKSKIIISQD
ncbi:hypothetical protein K4G58_07320 [Helicobacter sp. Faydin-H64]|uniref:Uncharacterized protein n=1 Tax=Helicobacter turcicus TaxID=2867412 RepID=A0ABS7JPA5_9HELI|nr:hypothetical protein [Helicobacter turcicus]MBX7546130.1 hypothetical protein [Helicobacter turcicus]